MRNISDGEEPGECIYKHDGFASRINWLGVQRIHHVEQIGQGQTLFRITEVYTGATWTASINYTQGVLETFLERLKQRAETLVEKQKQGTVPRFSFSFPICAAGVD